jgi:hypothetical protein
LLEDDGAVASGDVTRGQAATVRNSQVVRVVAVSTLPLHFPYHAPQTVKFQPG